MDKIKQALEKLFTIHRIVVWYDEKQELREIYEDLTLPGVAKIEIANNQFGVKYRILRQEPKAKFLLYHDGPRPADLDNWLLDVELAYTTFNADQASLWLVDMGLGPEFLPLVSEHREFFRARERRQLLRARRSPEDGLPTLRRKMLLICCGLPQHADLEEILLVLLDDLAQEKRDHWALIERCNLTSFLWERVQAVYGYRVAEPTLLDFVFTLFRDGYALSLGEGPKGGAPLLQPGVLVLLDHWKNNRQRNSSFEHWSNQYASVQKIETDLQHREIQELVELDLFELIDQRIIHSLLRQVRERTITGAACAAIVHRRQATHWWQKYKDIYQAIQAAAEFLEELSQSKLVITSLADGVEKYARTWHRLDRTYREFIYGMITSRQANLFQGLFQEIDNHYVNSFLLPLNNRFQEVVDSVQTWASGSVCSQQDFFVQQVEPYLSKGQKVAVVISDALRYEIGAALQERIRREDRFEAELAPMLAVLPSYTQLGMAALLPHQTLTLQEDSNVLVDGQSASGTNNRGKILAAAVSASKALRAQDFLKMNQDESRALFREHRVVYIYHNRIDAVGDNRDAEERVFEAVAETQEELVSILKKLANANFTHMLVTSDHGFLYQYRHLETSDFASVDVQGESITYRHRRFVLGHGLQESPSARRFTPAQVGLEGDVEIMIVKSINRLRQQGSGSRYVHGGAALQEVVTPVLAVTKKRTSDVEQIEVDLIGQTTTITTGQLTVCFYQTEPVSPKRQARILRAGIYGPEGQLISNQRELHFDKTSDNSREREITETFILSKAADEYNTQDVELRLEEQIPGTSHYQLYRSWRYRLQRALTSDFDF